MNDATRIVALVGFQAVPMCADDDLFFIGAEGELVILDEDSRPVAVYDPRTWTYGSIH